MIHLTLLRCISTQSHQCRHIHYIKQMSCRLHLLNQPTACSSHRSLSTDNKTLQNKATEIWHTVRDGSKSFLADCRSFIGISARLFNTKMSTESFMQTLTQRELETFYLMSRDLQKVILLGVIILMPFTFVLVGIAIIFLPRLILTHHFWSLAQRSEFMQICVDDRLSLANAFLRPRMLEYIKTKFLRWPQHPYDFEYLHFLAEQDLSSAIMSASHRFHLCRLQQCGFVYSFLLSNPLDKHPRICALNEMDRRLSPTDIATMNGKQIERQLYMRTICIDGLSNDSLRMILQKWAHFAQTTNCTWTKLHAPALLQCHGKSRTLSDEIGYNRDARWEEFQRRKAEFLAKNKWKKV